jgi:hypothetical protein
MSEKLTRDPAAIRVCPERDARCPHGIDCPFWIDLGSCDMEASRKALTSSGRAILKESDHGRD